MPFTVFSQTVTKIEGFITNVKQEIIANATIKIIESDTVAIVKEFAFSNMEGKFSIKVPSSNTKLYLQISFVGYKTYTIT